MAENFMKTMKRDYVAFMPKPDAVSTVRNLALRLNITTRSTRTAR
ncbi:hypothetical protein B0O95_11630 [Mycetohabitans endofungorum]|uniref:Uncharacterized protein n=1 Tax=Mycetohabitans endofungorum TaxID=417203 RepID=A0A2P5K7D1_9BURK|nr:hypothetical protein B0O95_11630 [Mycetohabitans endofungorum]